MPEKSGEFKKSSFNLKKVINKTLVAAIVGGTVACTPVDARPVIPTPDPDKKATSTLVVDPPKATPTDALVTITPSPTKTATETKAPTPTKTEVPEKYPIDIEKLNSPPQSYEELVNHPEKFVQAPNPVKNFEEFKTWYNEKLFEEALGGDLENIPANYKIDMVALSDRIRAYSVSKQERLSLPKFFYFKDKSGVYPCYVVTVAAPEYKQTYTVVAYVSDILFEPGSDFVGDVYQETKSFADLQLSFNKSEYYSAVENDLIDKGFGSFPSTVGEIPIGFGRLNFVNK